MSAGADDPEIDPAIAARVRALPLWQGAIAIAPLKGGITNRNLIVRDDVRRVVIRLGGDIPAHGIMRFNERAVSEAAARCAISPPILHAEPGLMAIAHIDGRTLDQPSVRGSLPAIAAMLRRVHGEICTELRGPVLAFNVFHVLRDYGHQLRDAHSPFCADLDRLLGIAATIEAALSPEPVVLAHNDLLAANFIDDGTRLWLIDWDYAGFNTPSFDLANLCANNGLTEDEEHALLHAYHGRAPRPADLHNLHLMRAASSLREAMWSMVQAIAPAIDFDYVAYAHANLAVFDAACARLPMPSA